MAYGLRTEELSLLRDEKVEIVKPGYVTFDHRFRGHPKRREIDLDQGRPRALDAE